MLSGQPECARLYLVVQRLVDQDVLGETDAAELLANSDAARRFLLAGDEQAALQQVARIGEFTRELILTEALRPASGRAVIELTERILDRAGPVNGNMDVPVP